MYGERIKQVRTDAKMSQEDFAKSIGCSQTALSGYEREAAQPPFETLQKIGSLYNVDMNWLLGYEKTDYHTLLNNEYDDFADLVSMGFSVDEAYRMEKDLLHKYGDMVMKLDYDYRKQVADLCKYLYTMQEKFEKEKADKEMAVLSENLDIWKEEMLRKLEEGSNNNKGTVVVD